MSEEKRKPMLSVNNQNKFVEHLVRQLKADPRTPLHSLELHAHLTFGSVGSHVENNKLDLYVDQILLEVIKKENQVEVWVDDELVDVIPYN